MRSTGESSAMIMAMKTEALTNTLKETSDKVGNGQQASIKKKAIQVNRGGRGRRVIKNRKYQVSTYRRHCRASDSGNHKETAREINKRTTVGILVTRTPSIGTRPAGAVTTVKTKLLSQAPFRSGYGLTIYRAGLFSATMFDPAMVLPSVNHATMEMRRGVVNKTQPRTQLDFEQFLAQVTRQNALIPIASLGNNNIARYVVSQSTSKGQRNHCCASGLDWKAVELSLLTNS